MGNQSAMLPYGLVLFVSIEGISNCTKHQLRVLEFVACLIVCRFFFKYFEKKMKK